MCRAECWAHLGLVLGVAGNGVQKGVILCWFDCPRGVLVQNVSFWVGLAGLGCGWPKGLNFYWFGGSFGHHA